MWGRRGSELRNRFKKWLKMHYFQILPSHSSYNRGEFLALKYEIMASQPFIDHLDIFPSKVLEKLDIFSF